MPDNDIYRAIGSLEAEVRTLNQYVRDWTVRHDKHEERISALETQVARIKSERAHGWLHRFLGRMLGT